MYEHKAQHALTVTVTYMWKSKTYSFFCTCSYQVFLIYCVRKGKKIQTHENKNTSRPYSLFDVSAITVPCTVFGNL